MVRQREIGDLMVDGLPAHEVEKIKKSLDADAAVQYQRITENMILMEKFKPQILNLRRSGFPWKTIADKLTTSTKKSISASTLRTYFERYKTQGAQTASSRRAKTPQSARQLDEAEPNVFRPEQYQDAQEPTE
jgi:hypothetical protein